MDLHGLLARRGIHVRPVIVALIAIQILLPLVMLVARHADPSAGQLPFGWQMHTTCWGSDDPRCS